MQLVVRAGIGGHRRKRRCGDRHSEERDGQRVDDLRVTEGGDGAARQPGGDERVDVGRELYDAAARDHRQEVAHHFGDLGVAAPETETCSLAEQLQHQGELYAELETAAADCAPRRPDRDARLIARRAGMRADDERGDDGGAPHHRRGVAEEELLMAVQHADAEGRQHQERDARKEDAHQVDREGARLSGKTGSDGVEQPRRRQHADEREDAGDQRQEPGDGASHLARLFLFALRPQRRVDGNERRRQHAFAQQVLQEIRNAESRGVRICGGRSPEIVAKHALPHKSGEPAEKDARTDQQRGSGGARHLRRSGCSRRDVVLRIGHEARRIPSPGPSRAPNLPFPPQTRRPAINLYKMHGKARGDVRPPW